MDQVLLVNELKFQDKGPYSFRLFQQDCIGITGNSGIGKTQLFRAIVDLIPSEGEIFCKGVSQREIDAPRWRSMITMVPAESIWWHDRVGEHFPVTDEHYRELRLWLEQLGFNSDVLEWQVTRLSTGEKQRLALLRSLSHSPVILLLDEPTSSLDSHHTDLVESFIIGYSRRFGVPVLWISHDENQMERVATRKFVMEKHSLTEVTE